MSSYLKLFAISGALWGFQIVDGFLEYSAFSYIISTLNCFQGLFIFVSFVLNKRTFHLIMNRQMQNDSLSAQNISSKNKKNHNGLTSTESIASTEDNTRM